MSYKLLRQLFLRIYRKFKRLFNTRLISFVIFLINNSTCAQRLNQQLMEIINNKNYQQLEQHIKLLTDFGQQESALIINKCIDCHNYDVLNYALSHQLIDVDTCLDQYGWTAFHRAVYNKDIELIVLLIKNEANIEVTDINGNTPLHILLQSSTQLITTDNKSVPDFGPESHYSIVILKLLLNYCKSLAVDVINRRNSFGKSALHYAVVNTGTDNKTLLSLMSLLLESGADPDSRDRLNRTPLFCAITEYSFSNVLKKQIVDKLIQSDCDPLNTYQFSQFGTCFTLKQLSRSCLLENYSFHTKYFSECLPKELNSYLDIKLIPLSKRKSHKNQE